MIAPLLDLTVRLNRVRAVQCMPVIVGSRFHEVQPPLHLLVSGPFDPLSSVPMRLKQGANFGR